MPSIYTLALVALAIFFIVKLSERKSPGEAVTGGTDAADTNETRRGHSKRTLVLVGLVAFALAIASCGAKGAYELTRTRLAENAIRGEWYTVANGRTCKVVFNGDGTFQDDASALVIGATGWGRYSLELGKLRLTSNDGYSDVRDYTLSRTTLRIADAVFSRDAAQATGPTKGKEPVETYAGEGSSDAQRRTKDLLNNIASEAEGSQLPNVTSEQIASVKTAVGQAEEGTVEKVVRFRFRDTSALGASRDSEYVSQFGRDCSGSQAPTGYLLPAMCVVRTDDGNRWRVWKHVVDVSPGQRVKFFPVDVLDSSHAQVHYDRNLFLLDAVDRFPQASVLFVRVAEDCGGQATGSLDVGELRVLDPETDSTLKPPSD